ncbi:hypothetical protein [Flammeovirga kamogawensis]|uniref:Outer membrane protein beta-barrel domain-containing protein n=1 Tax=Flammeovirga kamogawensis TaxID=373891 RepID=A0ABX8GZS0_9BACT|nr:hypothetical protein [Flammeovirga kamogawensis]MBB6459565.1 hypothetical protein [Flammeovirga kamogawensis]QWG09115.1 hypothetical protein KM029_09260 [Flammeovirga kamogawensis]TRX67403.1 hypothetical protein EO216_04300 [Flammeovirga kamogawensis]
MTKKLFRYTVLLSLGLLYSVHLNAQDTSNKKSTNTTSQTSSKSGGANYSSGHAWYLNAGFGFSNHGIPFYLGAEYNGLHPDISVGGVFSFHNKWDDKNHNAWTLSALGNYHFNRLLNLTSEWDVYAGANVGFYGYSNNSTGFGGGIQVGGRWFINDFIGLNLQFGGGTVSGGQFGVTFRL